MTSSHPFAAPCQWFSRLARPLDRRSSPRLAPLPLGAVLARGRRTVTTWIRAARMSGQFRSCYIAGAAAGKKAESIATGLFLGVVERAGRLTLALDDTPTKRYGPQARGAGVHHNPTAGPAGSPYVYGHAFVALGLLVTHKAWGTIALPLLSRLYIRKKGLPAIDLKHRPEFRTKPELAVELLGWANRWLGLLKLPIWVVADGAYAKREILKPAKAMGMTVVSRPRKDAALRSLPGPRPAGRRGPDLLPGRDRPGQARRPETRLVHRHVRAVRGGGGQAIQNVPGDLAPGRRRDPGGAGGRADGLAGVLPHRHPGERRRHPDDDRRSPIASARRSPSASASRSSGRASSRCGPCGRTWGRSTSACGHSR